MPNVQVVDSSLPIGKAFIWALSSRERDRKLIDSTRLRKQIQKHNPDISKLTYDEFIEDLRAKGHLSVVMKGTRPLLKTPGALKLLKRLAPVAAVVQKQAAKVVRKDIEDIFPLNAAMPNARGGFDLFKISDKMAAKALFSFLQKTLK